MKSSLLKERLKVAARMKKNPETPFKQIDLTLQIGKPTWMTRAFSNNRYTVMVMDNAKTTSGTAIRAMVQTVDDKPITNHWREMQRIKGEIFGAETMAIEYYPPASELIDQHNIYWLWIFPEGVIPKSLNK